MSSSCLAYSSLLTNLTRGMLPYQFRTPFGQRAGMGLDEGRILLARVYECSDAQDCHRVGASASGPT